MAGNPNRMSGDQVRAEGSASFGFGRRIGLLGASPLLCGKNRKAVCGWYYGRAVMVGDLQAWEELETA